MNVYNLSSSSINSQNLIKYSFEKTITKYELCVFSNYGVYTFHLNDGLFKETLNIIFRCIFFEEIKLFNMKRTHTNNEKYGTHFTTCRTKNGNHVTASFKIFPFILFIFFEEIINILSRL